MEVYDFIQAIGAKLDKLYPDYQVYDEQIKQEGFENCFHIKIINATQARQLLPRYKRSYDFDIAYFSSSGKNDLYAVEKMLLECFHTIEVDGHTYRTKDMECKIVDEILHLQFSVSFFIADAPDQQQQFENLHAKLEIKNNSKEV